jgi:hypothetical protein
MNVEDMIRFVLFHGSAAADEIERLQHQHQWVMDGLLPDGSRVAPYGRWAIACVAYGREGVKGLLPLLRDPAMGKFAVAVLEQVRSAESVEALIEFCATASFSATEDDHPDWAEWRAVFALNLLLSFDDCVQIGTFTLVQWQLILEKAFERAATPSLKQVVLLAARGTPSERGLMWIQNLQVKGEDLVGIQKLVIKVIRKRLQPDFKPLNADEKRQLRKERALDV